MNHLETRPSKSAEDSVAETRVSTTDYYVEFVSPSQEVTRTLLYELDKISSNIIVLPSQAENIWFPRHISELHRCCTSLFKYGHELASDHPGYGDTDYEKRRKDIAEIAKDYK